MWYLGVALGVTVIGILPWFLGASVEHGPRWAQSLLRGAAYIGVPFMAIGETFARFGWVGMFSLVMIYILTVAFWFGAAYGLIVFSHWTRLRRVHL